MKAFIVFLVILLLPLAVQAEEISFYKSESLISVNDVSFSDTILIPSNLKEISIDLFFKIKNFRTESTFVNYNCEALDTKIGSKLKCIINEENISGRINLFYGTEDLIKTIDSKLIYKNDFKVPIKVKKLSITTKLEEGLILINENNDFDLAQYLPASGQKGSDGRRIFIFWERENVEKGDGISTLVAFESLSNSNKSGQDLTLFYILFGFIIVLIAGLFFYRTKTSGIKSAINILKDDERKIIQILEELGGKAKQKQIQEKGDFSKATLSRLIKNLEERGLIKTERIGRTNRIYLNKNIDKKDEKMATKETANNEIINSAPVMG